ncbi:G-protein coupled receptor daf-37 isoform X1 [Hydra vulgaris]|uniref:G-protein coupled receptor daf-37 isoform X1 n=1 Tax=Hydra vulgaris TaxID=6087 RepID=UPI0001923EF6|nr:G-protein coupled receptor daf-37 [Hydra vulgaris]
MVSASDLHWFFSVPVGITITVLGLLGNTVSIFVWKKLINLKLRQNQSTGIYLIALGICDSGLLVFFLLFDSLPTAFPFLKNNSYHYAAFYSWIAFPFFFIFLIASIWLVVGVTLNRFFMIALPVKVKMLYTPVRTYIGIFVLLAFSLLINIPHFFNFKPLEEDSKWKIEKTLYGKSKAADNYEFWLHCIFLVLAPWICIAVLNSIILYKLSKQAEISRNTKNSQKYETKSCKMRNRENQMTRTLLVITFSFLVLLAWQCISQCFWMQWEYKKEKHSRVWEIVDKNFAFGKLGVVINSSINFILYCLTGTMFRKEFKKVFCFKISIKGKLLESIKDRSSSFGHSSTTKVTTIIENCETTKV